MSRGCGVFHRELEQVAHVRVASAIRVWNCQPISIAHIPVELGRPDAVNRGLAARIAQFNDRVVSARESQCGWINERGGRRAEMTDSFADTDQKRGTLRGGT